MKLIISILAAAIMFGCANQHSELASRSSPVVSGNAGGNLLHDPRAGSRQQIGESLWMSFDDQGAWQAITASGSARYLSHTPQAESTAYMIAALRAKGVLATYLGGEVTSEKSVKHVARALDHWRDEARRDKADPDVSLDDEQRHVGVQTKRATHRLATEMTESIREQGNAYLRGAYVSNVRIRSGTAIVEVTASRSSIGSARDVVELMSGVAR